MFYLKPLVLKGESTTESNPIDAGNLIQFQNLEADMKLQNMLGLNIECIIIILTVACYIGSTPAFVNRRYVVQILLQMVHICHTSFTTKLYMLWFLPSGAPWEIHLYETKLISNLFIC